MKKKSCSTIKSDFLKERILRPRTFQHTFITLYKEGLNKCKEMPKKEAGSGEELRVGKKIVPIIDYKISLTPTKLIIDDNY